MGCAYCDEGELLDAFGIKILELPASKVYLFKEQSHPGRVIVASRFHVSEMIDLDRRQRQAFMDDVATVASAIREIFKPQKINYGAYGDTGCHLHFHLVPKYADDEFEWGGTFAMNPKRKFLTTVEYAEMVAKIGAKLALGNGFDLHKCLIDLRKRIVADGKVDFCEATMLLKVVEPLEDSGASMREFASALRQVREDGVITPEESVNILQLLDSLIA